MFRFKVHVRDIANCSIRAIHPLKCSWLDDLLHVKPIIHSVLVMIFRLFFSKTYLPKLPHFITIFKKNSKFYYKSKNNKITTTELGKYSINKLLLTIIHYYPIRSSTRNDTQITQARYFRLDYFTYSSSLLWIECIRLHVRNIYIYILYSRDLLDMVCQNIYLILNI